MYTLQASLIYSSASIFTRKPVDGRTTLSMIRDSSELLPVLLENGHTTIAGRLAGAFRNIAREKIANGIIDTMKGADYAIRESDPFEYRLQVNLSSRERSPAVNRIKFLWQEMREVVINKFPKAPGLPKNVANYLQLVDDIYLTDAYHSLSIERYRVTPELIERVSSGKWDKDADEADKKQRDAMAARGYWLAFQRVKESISKILDGANSGSVINRDHAKWFTELFDPSVAAGRLKLSDLAGYRSSQVYIGGSKHTPLPVDAMKDAMPVLFELLDEEPEASVRAVLGHFIFVFIHPYMDGNGRMGRFLMNAMLASGGYLWTVIPVGKRERYMTTLEKASVENNIAPFAEFIGELVLQNMEGRPVANLDRID
ncbi:Fic family protein [Hufsiella ginkgonis]|uniref:Fic family protein n=1 Tax=Hufsiella ginkgonis TaxID=2695274 RepID=UPI0019276DD1|nr:Fic family protein [Hufsiella ginkgonis]